MLRFGPIHCLVGRDHQLIKRLAIDSKDRRSQTDADASPALGANLDGKCRDDPFDSLTKFVHLIDRHIRNNGNEFITSVPRQKIVFAQLGLNERGNLSQHPIAHFVAERVINYFEVIEVQHNQLECTLGAASARHLLFETNVEAASIRQTGKRIGEIFETDLVLRFINNLNKVVTSYIVGSSCMLEESHGYWTTKSTAGACR